MPRITDRRRNTRLWMNLTLAAALGVAAEAHAAQSRAFVFNTDFGTGAISDAHFGPPRTIETNVASVSSDAALRYFNGLLYVVNRFGADNIQVLDPSNEFDTVQQFSVGNGSNPHDIVFASPTKAFVTRYDATELWIVNPQTGQHTGTISLAGFADADGIPEMDHMALWAGRLFVSIQRLDRNNFFNPAGGSLVAVIDPVNDVDPGASGTQGILLPLQNPVTEMTLDADGKIVVGCTGFFGVMDGGVVRIHPGSLTVEATETTESALGGDLNDVEPFNGARGFAVINDADFNTIVRSYNRATGVVTGTPFSTAGFLIADIEVNDRGELWVSDRTAGAPGLRVFDAATGSQLTTSPLLTGLPPQDIEFDAATSTAVPAPGLTPGLALRLTAVRPNPARGAATVEFEVDPSLAAGASRAELVSYDVAGRIVRRMSRALEGGGVHRWAWDGKDAEGRSVPPGSYYLELRVGSSMARSRVLFVR